MFIGFIGPPMSGKTTIAAQVFAELKKNGYPAEFVAEQARYYIAFQKARGRNFKETPLCDLDQTSIMSYQEDMERVMLAASPDSIVVADSCTLNTIFYFTNMVQTCREATARYEDPRNLLYFSDTLPMSQAKDQLRVHNFEESRAIASRMKSYLECSDLNVRTLNGSIDMRVNDVLRDVYNLYNSVA